MDIKKIMDERIDSSDRSLALKRTKWTEYENMFNVVLQDNLSGQAKSSVFDPKLSTLTLDRESRVMAQLPTGKVIAVSKNDLGASKYMSLVLDKYITPNANAQFPFLIKNRLVNRYSNIYGNYFVFVDWDVKPNGYIGPDMWLIPIRDVFPQVGAMSLEDSDYITIRTWRPLSFFETPTKGLHKEASEIHDILKNKAGSKEGRSESHKSAREDKEYEKVGGRKGDGYYEVFSMYERDRWVDYVPAAKKLWRDGENPHDDEELPVLNKYSIPLVDDFMAIGDFERGKSMQYAINSTWNLSLDAAMYSIFPPMLLNKDALIASTAKWGPAAKWFYRGLNVSAANVASPVVPAPQSMSILNNLYGLMNASLLNQFGTTDTSVSSGTDPGFGKTPEALKMSQMRENARDNTDRFYQEQFMVQLYKKFVNLTSKKMKSNIQLRVFGAELEELSQKFDDFDDMYDEKSGKVTLSSKRIGNIVYDYEIVAGSTYMKDQEEQTKNLISFLQFYMANAQLVDQKLMAEPEAKGIQLSELFTRVFTSSGTQDWDKILVDKTKEKMLNADKQKFLSMLTQMGGGGVPPTPEEGGQPMPPGAEGQMPPADGGAPLPMPQPNGQSPIPGA